MFGCCFVLQGRQVCGAVVWCCREAGQACLLLCGAAGDEAGWDGCGVVHRGGGREAVCGCGVGLQRNEERRLLDIVLCVVCAAGEARPVGRVFRLQRSVDAGGGGGGGQTHTPPRAPPPTFYTDCSSQLVRRSYHILLSDASLHCGTTTTSTCKCCISSLFFKGL